MNDIHKPACSNNIEHRVELVCPTKLQGPGPDGFERNGKAWFVATELQSDLKVEVDSTHFHLHKFPLLSRSGLLNRLVFESSDTEKDHIKLVGLPGGAEAFELAAKFCYGVAVELTACNVAALRCAAEYLEMTEDLEEGNLVSKTEAFLSFVVLASWKDSISVLESCQQLPPWAENLQIVQRCCESIAWKACTDPKGIRWSFTGAGSSSKKQCSSLSARGSLTDELEKKIPQDWWFEDVCLLNAQYFARTINAIKVKGMRGDLVGAAIMHYTVKWLPCVVKDQGSIQEESCKGLGMPSRASACSEKDYMTLQYNHRLLLETIISILPMQKGAVSCGFLFRLLRAAIFLRVEGSYRIELERRVGMQLDQASLSDLFIPSFHEHSEGMLFDVDMIYRIVQYFLLYDQSADAVLRSPKLDSEASPLVPTAGLSPKAKVSRLVDAYLNEVATDPKLSLHCFQTLVKALPEHARTSDDSLYKAVDSFIKAHTEISDAEQKKLCGYVDVHKLSPEACVHALDNERMPLRMVVQVLFCEQMKLRNAVTGGQMAEELRTPLNAHLQFCRVSTSDSDPQSSREGWCLPHADIRALQHEVQLMRADFLGLKDYCSGLQQQVDKVSKSRCLFSWSSGWKKLSKFTASHQSKPCTASIPVSLEAPPCTNARSFEIRKANRSRRNSVS